MAAITDQLNLLYHQWDLASKLSAVAVPLLGGIWWLIRRDHSSVRVASLEIKQAVTSMFMDTIVDEARKLLKLLDDFLPEALSQASSPKPHRSRFDHFCDSLRNLNAEELDRNRYKEIIAEAFAGIIEKTIARLVEGAARSSRAGSGESLNPSGVRLELEGAVHLKFAFVSHASALAITKKRRYTRYHNAAIAAFTLAVIFIFLLWIPIFIDKTWAGSICIALLGGTSLAIPSGLIAVLLSYRTQQWLENRAELYKGEAGLSNDFAAWTQEQSA